MSKKCKLLIICIALAFVLFFASYAWVVQSSPQAPTQVGADAAVTNPIMALQVYNLDVGQDDLHIQGHKIKIVAKTQPDELKNCFEWYMERLGRYSEGAQEPEYWIDLQVSEDTCTAELTMLTNQLPDSIRVHCKYIYAADIEATCDIDMLTRVFYRTSVSNLRVGPETENRFYALRTGAEYQGSKSGISSATKLTIMPTSEFADAIDKLYYSLSNKANLGHLSLLKTFEFEIEPTTTQYKFTIANVTDLFNDLPDDIDDADVNSIIDELIKLSQEYTSAYTACFAMQIVGGYNDHKIFFNADPALIKLDLSAISQGA